MTRTRFIATLRPLLAAFAGALQLVAVAVPASAQAEAPVGGDSAPADLVSEAERLTQLQRAIASDEAKIVRLKEEHEAFSDEFEGVNKARESTDIRIEELKEQLDAADDPEEKTLLEEEIAELSVESELARKQADILVEAKKTLKEQIETLTQKIAADRAAYETQSGLTSTAAESTATPSAPLPAAQTAAPTPPTATPVSPLSPKRYLPGSSPTQAAPVPQAGAAMKESAAQIEARILAERMEQKAMLAEQEIVDFLDRKQALEQQIEFEMRMISTAEDAVANNKQVVARRQDQLDKAVAAGASKDDLAENQDLVKRAEHRLSEARHILNGRLDDLEELEGRLEDAEEYQATVTDTAQRKRLEAETARERSVWLESPLHPVNLGKWLIVRGPRMLLVAVATAALLLLTRLTARHIAGVMVRPGNRRRGGRKKRADTLALSMRSATNGVILVGGALLILQEAGIPVKTVLGGAAIFGVAIAFGAQNLMRDYFNGFMILLEDQFELNDLLTIGSVTGRVEHVNLRTTVLRDLQGRVHFIPNGDIKSVTNHTYEWARAVIDICVGYEEDVDRAMDVLLEIANDLRSDVKFGGYITDAPEMLGVDRFNDFGPVIRFMLKTKADRMFAVRREILRRVKNRFNELGIAIQDPNRLALQRPPGS